MKFHGGHKTDDILGRSGSTIDWKTSIKSDHRQLFKGYFQKMPRTAPWPDVLRDTKALIAAPKVKPFALYFEAPSGILLISPNMLRVDVSAEGLEVVGDQVTVNFGREKRRYLAIPCPTLEGFLENERVEGRFSLVGASDWHIFGTQLLRSESAPSPIIERGIALGSKAQMDGLLSQDLEKRRAGVSILVPESLITIGSFKLPPIFSFNGRLYISHAIVTEVEQQDTPGYGFPYSPVDVTQLDG